MGLLIGGVAAFAVAGLVLAVALGTSGAATQQGSGNGAPVSAGERQREVQAQPTAIVIDAPPMGQVPASKPEASKVGGAAGGKKAGGKKGATATKPETKKNSRASPCMQRRAVDPWEPRPPPTGHFSLYRWKLLWGFISTSGAPPAS